MSASASGDASNWKTFDFPYVAFPQTFTTVYEVLATGTGSVVVVSLAASKTTVSGVTCRGKLVYDGSSSKGTAKIIAIGV